MRNSSLITVFAFLLAATLGVGALGGLGGGPGGDDPGDDTVKITLKPMEEESKIYGWVRITTDQFNLGANRLPKDQWYGIYLVTGEERLALGERPVRQTSGSGELKFGTRLEEPLGGKWDKIVVYHQPNGEKSNEGMVPILEGSLR